MKIKINIIDEKNFISPEYMSENAAGADIYSCVDENILIKPNCSALIPCGFSMEIPHGYEVQIRPRSGLAFKNCITVLNSPGTIDSDYRGEVKVILINHGKEDFTVTNGMRIAQMIVNKVEKAQFEISDNLSETGRGSGGFGHTGV
jgi:dUTP pyrophosphatase